MERPVKTYCGGVPHYASKGDLDMSDNLERLRARDEHLAQWAVAEIESLRQQLAAQKAEWEKAYEIGMVRQQQLATFKDAYAEQIELHNLTLDELAECQAHAKILETGAGVSLGELAASQKLVECQAQAQVLRDALERLAKLGNGDVFGNSEGNTIAYAAYTMPSDSTALDSAIKQAKREALLEAAEEFNCEPTGPNPSYPQFSSTHVWGVLRKMADDLKS
jgi:hypothetical protein